MRALLSVLLVGCASGHAVTEALDGDVVPPADAGADADGMPVDAKVTPVDAMPDAKPIDAPPDAYQCVVMTKQLLLNPAFDLTPVGTNWVQQNINNSYPIITDQDGIPEHSAPYKAWLGGLVAPTIGQSVTDVLYQDVTIPANTTMLRLTGYYEVRSGETGAQDFDTAQVGLIATNGTPIETAIALSNQTKTTQWTALDKTFTTNLSGQTVRLRFTSSNDFSLATAFFFDTLALTATYCQ